MNPEAEKEKPATRRAVPARKPLPGRTGPVQAHVHLTPTAKLAAAMGQVSVGPFKTKKELFDALEADEG